MKHRLINLSLTLAYVLSCVVIYFDLFVWRP